MDGIPLRLPSGRPLARASGVDRRRALRRLTLEIASALERGLPSDALNESLVRGGMPAEAAKLYLAEVTRWVGDVPPAGRAIPGPALSLLTCALGLALLFLGAAGLGWQAGFGVALRAAWTIFTSWAG